MADEVAIAAESRGFKSNNHRSSLNNVKLGKNDYSFAVVTSIILIFVVMIDKTSLITL
jgi:energy-coupling factor transporter transmembrane protein EcfT